MGQGGTRRPAVALTREVNDALNKATALRERAKAATRRAARHSFAQAREQAQRALALVENGPVDAMLATQVRQLQTELDEEEKDRKLVAALDEARLAQAESCAGQEPVCPRAGRAAVPRGVPGLRSAGGRR